MNDSRFYIQFWNYYDWLGVFSVLVILAILGCMWCCGLDAAKRFISYLRE